MEVIVCLLPLVALLRMKRLQYQFSRILGEPQNYSGPGGEEINLGCTGN
jgi:hypothetical protein